MGDVKEDKQPSCLQPAQGLLSLQATTLTKLNDL